MNGGALGLLELLGRATLSAWTAEPVVRGGLDRSDAADAFAPTTPRFAP